MCFVVVSFYLYAAQMAAFFLGRAAVLQKKIQLATVKVRMFSVDFFSEMSAF